MKIKKIQEIGDIKEENIDLNIEKKVLSITFFDISKFFINQCRVGFRLYNNLHVVTENNKYVSLISLCDCNIDDYTSSLHIKFNHIFIGIDVENEIVDNIDKYKVIFEKNIISKNKYLEDDNYDIILENNYVEITNKFQLENNDNYFSEFLKVYELIFLFIGYFPNIKKIELYKENYIIEEYLNLLYHYYSSKDIISEKFALVDIDNISNENNIINLWDKLKNDVGKYPIIGLFISQMEDNHYSEYKFVILLQSIDGYRDKKISNELYQKSEKDQKVINRLIDIVDSWNEMKGKDKEELKKYMKGYHNSRFEEILKKLMENDSLKDIFFEEMYLDKLNENCNSYVRKNDYLRKIVNERNLISHMSIKPDRLTDFQRRISYYKWLLSYRIILIEELGIKIDNLKLENCIKKIRTINKMENEKGCKICEYKSKCKIEKL